ncbi:hypothetical protein RIF23_19645 [Lipingzhangella sp. LS1_29]|uniref:Uncharacterized protein n=1 Tax=Lipingzhangella rawalii TaxID=2055835 RepID=A0ABU2HB50_9ACTN|nr:hypothetical protein [Lipingzhangella rawalii]MDS1272506.1 hypothetical protein [Lipingzhangella rawalii]
MRWVVYLSPSGGDHRVGIVDDGCVHGYPGAEQLAQLLDAPEADVYTAHEHALNDPTEIIVEFEARLCAPIQPPEPVAVRRESGPEERLDPRLLVGTDDGAPLPANTQGLWVESGLTCVPWGREGGVGYAPACLWRHDEGHTLAVTTGPALVLHGGADAVKPQLRLTVTGETIGDQREGVTVALESPPMPGSGLAEPVIWLRDTGIRLDPGMELHIDGGILGEFEIRPGE